MIIAYITDMSSTKYTKYNLIHVSFFFAAVLVYEKGLACTFSAYSRSANQTKCCHTINAIFNVAPKKTELHSASVAKSYNLLIIRIIQTPWTLNMRWWSGGRRNSWKMKIIFANERFCFFHFFFTSSSVCCFDFIYDFYMIFAIERVK